MVKTGQCPICEKTGKLHRDHCHRTGYEREGLCNTCNLMLGRFEINPVLLKNLTAYINKWMPITLWLEAIGFQKPLRHKNGRLKVTKSENKFRHSATNLHSYKTMRTDSKEL